MKNFKNYLHDFERFGFSPPKLYSRLFEKRSHLPKIISISIPKSGTNLIQRILTLHPQLYRRTIPTLGRRNHDLWKNWQTIFPKTKPGEIISSHFDYDPELEQYLINDASLKIIFLARDPRDIVISDMYYILKRPDHGYHKELKAMKSESEMLSALILGTDTIRPIDKQIKRFTGWISPQAFYAKFEDLVGEGGGGNNNTQKNTIDDLYSYLGITLSPELLDFISKNCRSAKSQTFRKGTINNWKQHFNEDIKTDFKNKAGDLLIQMGYEKDLFW